METKFKRVQTELKLPVREMSEICGVSQQLIYYWREYGVRNWRTAGRLAKRIGCSPEDIIGTIQQ